MAERVGAMETADGLVVALYFAVVLAVGGLATWRANRSTVRGYFLAGHSMHWAAVGASLFVSNIGSEHFIGLAGSGAANGLSVAAWELNALVLLQLLGWVFIPVYLHSGVYTMPQFLAKRFGGRRLKVYLAALALLLYVFTKLSVDLYAGALFIQESLGWSVYPSVILLIAVTAVLTMTGGLAAVIYTDVVQALLMVAGALCLTAISLVKVGGIEGLGTKYMQASPNITAILLTWPNLTYTASCYSTPTPNSLKILRGPLDPDLPWPGFLFGQTPASLWYWCADQVIVQRVLAAKNLCHAKGSTIMAGFLKILPMFIIVIPGMISRILFADELACISPDHCLEVCGSRAGCSNVAYPRLVMAVMPVGLRGLMMAVMIAALMSDLDSIFNSASTIFTLDIYTMLRCRHRRVSSRELLLVGRLFVIFMVIVSIAWVPVIIEMQGGQMFYYIQEVCNYLTPPIAALFLLGVIWRRCNETGAFWGAMTGLTLGLLRLGLAFVYRKPHCDQPDERPAFIKDVHFMYVAAILFWVSALVTVVLSLCTAPPSLDRVRTTTLWGLHQRSRRRVNHTEDRGSDGEEMESRVSLEDGITEKSPALGQETSHNSRVAGGVPPADGHSPKLPGAELQPTNAGAVRVEEEEDLHEGEGQGDCLGGRGGEHGWCLRGAERICGFKQEPSEEPAVPSAQENERLLDELLHEPLRMRVILNSCLVLICSIAMFLFLYFSL
ncbi:hypothetical protein NHX12_015968 [Muraenolepis orangiensis]|uniref:Sodium/myo-inositol cotransporter n=1 Tax=Muraenolepis orangiensis TaxID=630683 RepID=A0A9Q0D535_9TELE|nr:hypothetical protein NHX12_015968 [Muraenolepis orangiensis]